MHHAELARNVTVAGMHHAEHTAAAGAHHAKHAVVAGMHHAGQGIYMATSVEVQPPFFRAVIESFYFGIRGFLGGSIEHSSVSWGACRHGSMCQNDLSPTRFRNIKIARVHAGLTYSDSHDPFLLHTPNQPRTASPKRQRRHTFRTLFASRIGLHPQPLTFVALTPSPWPGCARRWSPITSGLRRFHSSSADAVHCTPHLAARLGGCVHTDPQL